MLNRIWFIKTFYLNKNKSGIQVIIQQNTLFPLQLSLQSNLTMKHLTCYSDRKRFYTWFCLFFFLQTQHLITEAYSFPKKPPHGVFWRGKITFAAKHVFFTSLCSQNILLLCISSKIF